MKIILYESWKCSDKNAKNVLQRTRKLKFRCNDQQSNHKQVNNKLKKKDSDDDLDRTQNNKKLREFCVL